MDDVSLFFRFENIWTIRVKFVSLYQNSNPSNNGENQQEKDEENEEPKKVTTKKKRREIELPVVSRVTGATKHELERLVELEVRPCQLILLLEEILICLERYDST